MLFPDPRHCAQTLSRTTSPGACLEPHSGLRMVNCNSDGNRAVDNGLKHTPSLSSCPEFEEAREHRASETVPTLMSLCYCSTSVLVRAPSMSASAPLSTFKSIQHIVHRDKIYKPIPTLTIWSWYHREDPPQIYLFTSSRICQAIL